MKALQTKISPFLLFVAVFFSTKTVLADDCTPKSIDIWTTAGFAFSGDTVIIQNQKFKLIGVKAPQRERKQKFSTRGQPLAKESQDRLNKLLANHDLEIGVEYDQSKNDSFNRGQVHLYVKQGEKVVSLNKLMLETGLALAETLKPNLKHQQCYYEAEKWARNQKNGLWGLAAQQPELNYPIGVSTNLSRFDDGYRIYQGKIISVDKSSQHYILNMDTTGVRIKKEHWKGFNYNQLKKLKGQTIEARGRGTFWKGNMFVWIESPNAIDKLNPINTKQ